MTFREKLAKEHPDRIDERYDGGAMYCPYSYGYEPENNKPCFNNSAISCKECWDREIPAEDITSTNGVTVETTPGEHFTIINIPPDASYVEILGHRITGDFKTFEGFLEYLRDLEAAKRELDALKVKMHETVENPVESLQRVATSAKFAGNAFDNLAESAKKVLEDIPEQMVTIIHSDGVAETIPKILDSGDRTEFATGVKFAGAACETLAEGAKKVLESVNQPAINQVVDEVHMQCGNFQITKHPDGSSTWIKTGEDTPDEPKISSLQEYHERVTELHRNVGEALESQGSIKDSGDRTQFETGAVRDMREGKGRCDLMPLEVVAKLLTPDLNLDTNDLVIGNIALFRNKNFDTLYLYRAIYYFAETAYGAAYGNHFATMLLEVAKHFEEGAKKYGENNWQKGIPVKCYIDSAIRHYLKWLRGDKDEPHDRAFVWNIMCCIWEVDYHKSEEENHEEN